MGRLVLICTLAVAAANVWTGAPLLGLWAASRADAGTPAGIAIFAAVFVPLLLALLALLARLGARFDERYGGEGSVRRHVLWIRGRYTGGPPLAASTRERVVMTLAVATVLALEIWFFFFSGSPIDPRPGR